MDSFSLKNYRRKNLKKSSTKFKAEKKYCFTLISTAVSWIRAVEVLKSSSTTPEVNEIRPPISAIDDVHSSVKVASKTAYNDHENLF